MHVAQLTRRTQLLLDDDLHERLRQVAAERGISLGALIREAIDEKLSSTQQARAEAAARLLAEEPMPVDDWPIMKKEMLEGRYGATAKLYDDELD